MRIVPLTAVVVLLLVAPAMAGAQASTELAEGDPVELLVQLAPELELTPGQVERLRLIQRELDDRNRPLVERLVEIQRREIERERSGEPSRRRGRGVSRTHIDMARAPLRQIHINNFRAMTAVSDVLTDDQKRTAARLLDLPRESRRWRR